MKSVFRQKSRIGGMYVLLGTMVPVWFLLSLFFGAVVIPFSMVWQILWGQGEPSVWRTIVLESRLPQALTALLSGAALATGGLLLQTLFRNPLAEPSILGVSAGANLGVAIVLLLLGGTLGSVASFSLWGHLAVVIAAFVGACAVLVLIVWFSLKVTSQTMLLIIGVMIGFFTSGIIYVLNFYATTENVHLFVLWTMGDFSGVGIRQLVYLALPLLVGLGGAVLLIKPLNALLLGERYAENLGVRVTQVRVWILLCTGLLTAVVTAFCGPISFIGMASPHLARLLSGTSDHKHLLPHSLLVGANTAMLCNWLVVLPAGGGIFPLNAVTPLLGVPVMLYVILHKRRQSYFT